MNEQEIAEKVVDKMYGHDLFSQWLGIERVKITQGYCMLRMTVRSEMLNGFNIVHGGITYSLADSALAFAANSYGRISLSVENSMSYLEPVKAGEQLTAVAEEMSKTNKFGVYHVTITNSNNIKVALFKGTVYRTEKQHFPQEI